MSVERNFMGLDSFVWFIGVIEDRQDPLALGRVRVRAYGWHSSSLVDIPSEDLPWASVMQSSSDAPPLMLKENDVIMGFFADGRSAQVPIVMGLLPGFQVRKNETGQGFNDLRKDDVLKNAPRKPTSRTYNADGSGIKVSNPDKASHYPLDSDLETPTLSGATRYEIVNTVIQDRKTNLDKNILTALGKTWNEPYPAYNALYPYNKALETESGHLIEYDDTPGNERICFTHRTGSFYEFYPSGSKVEKITKSNYQIIMGDDHLHVMGKVMITIDQDAYIKVVGDANIEVDNDVNMDVSGKMNLSVGEDLNIKAKTLNMDIGGVATLVSEGNQFFTSKGDLHLDAQGSGYLTGKGKVEILASETVDIMGSGINCEISADAAQSGSPTGLSEPASRGTPSSGEASIETTPVPFPENFKHLDAYTGSAYVHGLLLDNGNPPDSNNNTKTSDCGYDVKTKTFIPSDEWTISTNGLNFLKAQEGLSKKTAAGIKAYPDPVTGGEPITIGYGTTSAVLPIKLTLDTIITKEQAEQYLEDSVDTIFLPKLQEYIDVDLTQNQIDALISLMYNIGIVNFSKSTLRKDINNENWCKAADDFLMWNKAAGQIVPALSTRRKRERTLFLT